MYVCICIKHKTESLSMYIMCNNKEKEYVAIGVKLKKEAAEQILPQSS